MTKEEFISLLPASIERPLYGVCRLQILSDNKLVKAACYEHSKKVKFGFRQSQTFALLYLEMVDFLEKEVF